MRRNRSVVPRIWTGEEKQKRRTQNLVDFRDDPRTVILFATDAGGVGLNLQHAANCCINIDLPWNPAVLEQRIGRIFRLGQKKPINVFNLVSENGIEQRIADLIGTKRELFNGIFEGTSDEVNFSGSSRVMRQLEKLVEPVVIAPFQAQLTEDDDYSDAEQELPEIDDGGAPIITQEAEASTSSPVISLNASVRAPLAGLSEVGGLLDEIKIERTADGEIQLRASSGTAARLATTFRAFADIFEKMRGA